MKKKPLKEKVSKPPQKHEELYEDVNLRSFEQNFEVLIHNYKKRSVSFSTKSK